MSAAADDHEAVRPEPPKTYYGDVVKIPGYGEAPNRCRPMTPVGFCETGHVILGRSSCGTRYCPDHWREWTEQAVINQVARLAAWRHIQEGAGKRLCHVMGSFPADRRYSLDRLWKTRSEAYEALEAAGVRGGAAALHPYRTNERGDGLFQTAADEGELPEGTGKWAFLRDVSDDWEDLTRYIEPSPHIHALAAAEDVDGEAAPDGWVVKRIRTFQPFHYQDTEAYRDMVATAYYILTHAGVQDGRHSLTYFGDVHPASFDPEEELTAAVWDRIQIEAEKAVTEEPGVTEEGMGAGPEECPRDGCEAAVVDVYYLREYMEDEEWLASVRAGVDGRSRWLRLRGLMLWWEEGGDRPPPSLQASEDRLLAWLEDRGRAHTPRPQQVSLTTAVM